MTNEELKNMSEEELLVAVNKLLSTAKERLNEADPQKIEDALDLGDVLPDVTEEDSLVGGFLGTMALVGVKVYAPEMFDLIKPYALEFMSRLNSEFSDEPEEA